MPKISECDRCILPFIEIVLILNVAGLMILFEAIARRNQSDRPKTIPKTL